VKLRAQVPYLVQGSALLDWLTLEDNVALASSTRSRGATHDALHRMGLWSLKDRTPPQVGPGIRKRAALARALVLNPRCLLLDEPTTGLDAKAAEQVEEALLTIRQQGLGAIIVSHDYRALSVLADRVIALHQGAVAYQGSKEGFLEWAKVAKG
jgi:phospholipid/cholesterol/gamma-HCH transport system ATP-binding protein